jgi:uncharacterized membrane protein
VPVHRGPFGDDAFGRGAEKVARFFGTPHYIIGQTIVVIAWIVLNSIAVMSKWDPYPFILLNLAFSTQAAYAAPLILLAQTRQAERDNLHGEMVERKHTSLEDATKMQTDRLVQLLESNTDLTEQGRNLTDEVARLTREIHAALTEKG